MTPEELKQLIQSDQQAAAFATAGNDEACAARCSQIAPKAIHSTRMTDLGILSLFPNPSDGEAVCQQIEAVAKTNPIVARAWKWALPPNEGIDVGNAKVRQLLTLPVASGGVGLSPQQAAPILAVAESTQTITAADVAVAWRVQNAVA